jgi:hypothetical protein
MSPPASTISGTAELSGLSYHLGRWSTTTEFDPLQASATLQVTHGMRVTGVDTPPPLITLRRERLLDQEWIVTNMRALGTTRTFEGILAGCLEILSPIVERITEYRTGPDLQEASALLSTFARAEDLLTFP